MVRERSGLSSPLRRFEARTPRGSPQIRGGGPRSDLAAEQSHGRGQEPDLSERNQEQDRSAEDQQALVRRRSGTRYVHASHVRGETAEGQRAEGTSGSSQDGRRRRSGRCRVRDRPVSHSSRSRRGGRLVVPRGHCGLSGRRRDRRRQGLGSRGRLGDRLGRSRFRLWCRVGSGPARFLRSRVRRWAPGGRRGGPGCEQSETRSEDERPAGLDQLRPTRPLFFQPRPPPRSRRWSLICGDVSNAASLSPRASTADGHRDGTSCSRTKLRGTRDRQVRTASRAAASPECS